MVGEVAKSTSIGAKHHVALVEIPNGYHKRVGHARYSVIEVTPTFPPPTGEELSKEEEGVIKAGGTTSAPRPAVDRGVFSFMEVQDARYSFNS